MPSPQCALQERENIIKEWGNQKWAESNSKGKNRWKSGSKKETAEQMALGRTGRVKNFVC